MRRLFMLLAAPAVAALAVGCCHTHGVCDCDADFDNHCATRAPWVAYSPAPHGDVHYHGPETIHQPRRVLTEPDAPKELPNVAPKVLGD